MLFREKSLFILRIVRKKRMNLAGKTGKVLIRKHSVYVVTPVLEGLIEHGSVWLWLGSLNSPESVLLLCKCACAYILVL
jgi:hypothetical protein